MPVISWSRSECKDSWLHIYEIMRQSQSAVVEICKLCGDKQVFKLFKGNPDKQTYLAAHLHQALPRFHRLWSRQYTLFKKLNGR